MPWPWLAVPAIALHRPRLLHAAQHAADQCHADGAGGAWLAVSLFAFSLFTGQSLGVALGAPVIDRFGARPVFAIAAVVLISIAFWFRARLMQADCGELMFPSAECARTFAMSWSRHGRGGRRGYHHGNLREALIGAALDLISQKGPAGFTFAEAARQAGVSPAAPYRHFRDRDALMADVARQASSVSPNAWLPPGTTGRPSPTAALERLGRAYLGFAREEPAYFSAMFESGVPVANHRDLHEAGDRAFGVLRQACEAVVAGLPAGKRPPALMMALHIWALSHGIASLFARGDAARRNLPMTPKNCWKRQRCFICRA